MSPKPLKRASLYVRVSTDRQTVENQLTELRQIAERRGWQVVAEYHDAGVSGAKGRDQRPGLDRMLADAARRRFDVVRAWAIDRLGRSLIDLLGTSSSSKPAGSTCTLTNRPSTRRRPPASSSFEVTGAFAEFEHSMIRQRVNAGLKRP